MQEMMSQGLKCALVLSCGLLAANAAFAAEAGRIIYAPAHGAGLVQKARAQNVTNHGGPVITAAHVVFIFWGPTFADATNADHVYATTLQTFRNQFGTTGQYNTITQYTGSNGTIALSNLAGGTADLFD